MSRGGFNRAVNSFDQGPCRPARARAAADIKQRERFKTMLKFIAYMAGVNAAVAAALDGGVLIT